MESNFFQTQNEIELKDKQIKNLQEKLDSQDIIIKDYFTLKDKFSESKIEINNLKKQIEKLNLAIASLTNQLRQKDVENKKFKNINTSLSLEFKDLKAKSNNANLMQDKLIKDINEYKKMELLLKNIQNENEILNAKISNLNDIEKKSEKVMDDLKTINGELSRDNAKLKSKVNDYEKRIKTEENKNKELLEINKIVIEDKKKLNNEIIDLKNELSDLKNNLIAANGHEGEVSADLNQKSRELSEIKVKMTNLENENKSLKEQIEKNNITINKEGENKKNLEKKIEELKGQILKCKEENIALCNSVKSNNIKNRIINLENENKELKENNNKLMKDKDIHKNNIDLFSKENKEASLYLQKLSKEKNELEKINKILEEEVKKSKQNNNERIQEKDKYINDLLGKITIYEKDINDNKDAILKLNVRNKMDTENKAKFNEILGNYQKIIENERNKSQNSEVIISRLRAELDYIKEKAIAESKLQNKEISKLNNKILALTREINQGKKLSNNKFNEITNSINSERIVLNDKKKLNFPEDEDIVYNCNTEFNSNNKFKRKIIDDDNFDNIVNDIENNNDYQNNAVFKDDLELEN